MKKLLFVLMSILVCAVSFGQTEKMLKSVVEAQKAQNKPSSGVEFLSGRIMIQMKEITYYDPLKNGRRRCVQKETTISSGLYGRISASRVKLYIAKPSERTKCEPETSCPVFNGSTKFVLSRDPNTMKINEIKEYPLMVITKYLEQDFKWMKDKEKYVVTASQSASGQNMLEDLNIEIKPYKPASNSDGATLMPLKPAYVLWITGGRDWTQAEEPKQDGTNLRWDDIKEQLKPINETVSLGIPYEINSPEKPMYNGQNVYQQLLLYDVKGFDEFLLNPWRAYGITATGNRYYKDDYSETKIGVTVTISLSNDADLPPLENVDDIDVTPLESLGEEIPLAPLEPIKD